MKEAGIDLKNSRTKKIRKEVVSAFFIILAVLAFRSVVYEPFRIPSGSMIPTLYIGDFILVSKFSYGIKVPFSDFRGQPVYLMRREGPQRGDVVVFKKPREEETDYIKRVVGLPGDSVLVEDGIVYINGEAIPQEQIDGSSIQEDMDTKYVKNIYTGEALNTTFYRVQTGGHDHVIMHDDDRMGYFFPSRHDRVPDGHYFVMGDNRENSEDSRFWGYVPFENIKGKAVLIWFNMTLPFLNDERAEEDEFRFRPWRIGTVIP